MCLRCCNKHDIRLREAQVIDEDTKRYIDAAIRETIEAYKRGGILKDSKEIAYSESSKILSEYYRDGMKDENITKALEEIFDDRYFEIIPQYFLKHLTIEQIAEAYNVDVSTIVRNKKRLCIDLYVILN